MWLIRHALRPAAQRRWSLRATADRSAAGGTALARGTAPALTGPAGAVLRHALRRPVVVAPIAIAVLGAATLLTWQSTLGTQQYAAAATGAGLEPAPPRLAFSSRHRSQVGYLSGTTTAQLSPEQDAQPDSRGNRIVYLSHRRHTENQVERDGEVWHQSTLKGRPTRLTNDDFVDAEPAVSPNGRWVAYASKRGGEWDLWVVPTTGAEAPRRLTSGPADDRWPSWSPGSDRIAFSSTRDDPAGDIYVLGVTDAGAAVGQPTRLTDNPAGDTEPAWAPVGDRLAFTTTRSVAEGQIVTMPTGGGAVTPVVVGREAAWSPDAASIAYTRYVEDANGDVYTLALNGDSEPVRHHAWRAQGERHPTWPTAELLLFTITGHEEPIPRPGGGTDYPSDLYAINIDRTGLTNVTHAIGTQSAPDYSPDGHRLAYRDSGPVGPGIVVSDWDGVNPRLLVRQPEGAYDDGPAWSPDGRYLAFSRRVSDQVEGISETKILIADAADGRILKTLPCGGTICQDSEPTWSPTGRQLAFSRGVEQLEHAVATSIFVLDIDADLNVSNHRDISTAVGPTSPFGRYDADPDWSPRGDAIVFGRNGNYLISVAPDGGNSRLLLDEPYRTPRNPTFSPDGRQLAFEYTWDSDSGSDIYLMPADASAEPRAVHDDNGSDRDPDFQPAADLVAAIEATPAGILLDRQSTARLRVFNAGPSPATNARATITVPPGLRATAIRATAGTCDLASLTCTLGELANRAEAFVTIDLTGVAAGNHPVSASVANDRYEADERDNRASDDVSVSTADVAVAVTVDPVPGYRGGAPIRVTYTLTNQGTTPADGVRFTATLPAELPVRGTPEVRVEPPGAAPACPDPRAGCDLGAFPAGRTVTIVVTLGPDAGVNTVAVGTVTATAATGGTENDRAQAPLRVLVPEITIDPKTGSPNFLPVVSGRNFPPGLKIRLSWSRGVQTNRAFEVAGDGTFRHALMVFPTDRLYGNRDVRVASWSGAEFGPVEAPYVVVPGRNTPDNFVVRR